MEAARCSTRLSMLAAISLVLLSFQCGSGAFVMLKPHAALGGTGLQRCRRGEAGLRASRCSTEAVVVRTRWPQEEIERKRSASLHNAAADSFVGKAAVVKDVAGPFERAIKKPAGTISVIGCIKRKDPSLSSPIVEFKSAAEIAAALHDAKVSAIGCWIDEPMYGCTIDDLQQAVASQQKFRGNFPGPCPVLALDIFLEPSQLAPVSAAGAAAVLLSAALLDDAAKLQGMVDAAASTGLESLVLCDSADHLTAAAAAGARLLALDTRLLGVDGAIAAAAAAATATAGRALVAVGGLSDIADIWRLRGAGFHAAAVGEALMATAYGREGEVRQGGGKEGLGSAVLRSGSLRQNDLNTFVRGATAKASAKFGPTSADAFREKGAKFKRHYEV